MPPPRPAVRSRPLAEVVGPWASFPSDEARRAAAARITGITLDSRQIRPGDLYVAVPGVRAHGARFASQAVASGAAAVLTDAAGAADLPAGLGVPVAVADDVRVAMAHAAEEWYAHPADSLRMFGVTGTNGKTTTVVLLAQALRGLGLQVGTIGTLGFELDGEDLGSARTTVTTPESVDLHRLLALMRDRGADAVAMEVSSHAMAMQRTEPIRFDVAAFTNLSPEHLDFHADMEDYFEAKAALFRRDHAAAAVINVDDAAGVRLAERVTAGGVPLRTLSWKDTAADYRITPVPGGSIRMVTPAGALALRLALPGDFNVTNAVTALAMIELAGFDVTSAAAALAHATVPGRMQPVALPADAPAVYVDFAHTPEAVRSALAAFAPDRARGRRVVAVLGCGGDRDRGKRAPMGRAGAEAADLLVVTDDNPRTEPPAAIRAEVLEGAYAVTRDAGRVVDGGERRAAIAYALRAVGPGDVVVVLGKGHEPGQQIGDRVVPFDDRGVVAEEWAAQRGGKDS